MLLSTCVLQLNENIEILKKGIELKLRKYKIDGLKQNPDV